MYFIGFSAVFSQNTGKVPDPDPTRFQDEINAFINWDAKNASPANPVLFIGSSSIRMWLTHLAFPELPIVNRGFGGAEISDLIYYYNTVVKPYTPDVIVFYCGDNDIADHKDALQTFGDFKKFRNKILEDFPNAVMIYLPAKPSSSRWQLYHEMQKLNKMVQDLPQKDDHLIFIDTATPLLGNDGKPDDRLFRDDRLHLNGTGYAIWNNLLEPVLKNVYQNH